LPALEALPIGNCLARNFRCRSFYQLMRHQAQAPCPSKNIQNHSNDHTLLCPYQSKGVALFLAQIPHIYAAYPAKFCMFWSWTDRAFLTSLV
jgi:hypothetical protein